jgi:NADH:ubiquinone oxidoreductase subunit F (NADH-binding)
LTRRGNQSTGTSTVASEPAVEIDLDGYSSWMADENAGQCGPCQFGLPRLADTFRRLASAPQVSTDPTEGGLSFQGPTVRRICRVC